MLNNERRDASAYPAPEADTPNRTANGSNAIGCYATASRSVAWWPVYEFVARLTESVPDWPLAGTPAWCALDDADPRKLAAVLDAGQQNALRWETTQQAAAEASKTIAAAADWPGIAQELSQRHSFYAARPWLKRQAVNHA